MAETASAFGGGYAYRTSGGAVPQRRERGFDPSIIMLIVACMVLPRIFAVDLAGVRLTPLRIALLLVAIPAIVQFLSKRRLMLFDALYIAFAFWSFICIIYNRGIGGGLEFGGQFFLETGILYIACQAYLVRISQITTIVNLLFWLTFGLLILAIIENTADSHIFLRFFQRMMGAPETLHAIGDRRLGMIRATTIFSHPIISGLFCSSTFALLWYLQRNAAMRVFQSLVVILATFLSLSSGPILALMFQMGAVGTEMTTRWLPNRFRYIAAGVGAILAVFHFFSGRGIFTIIAWMVLNPNSAYYRKHLWNNATDDVWRNPILGMRPENWTRPAWMSPSVDNYWLLQAMQGGLPSIVFIFAAMGLLAYKVFSFRSPHLPDELQRLRRGWAYTMLAMALCAATVHFFHQAQPLFALIIALGGVIYRLLETWERDAGSDSAAGEVAAPVQPPRRTLL